MLQEKLDEKNKEVVDSGGLSAVCAKRCKGLERHIKLLKHIIAFLKDRLTE